MTTFEVDAWHNRDASGVERPMGVTVAALVATSDVGSLPFPEVKAIGQAWLDQSGLPKACGFKPSSLSTIEAGAFITYPRIAMRANLWADGVNGGRNETGIARYHKVMAALAAKGYEVVWTSPYGNAYETREAFEAALKED